MYARSISMKLPSALRNVLKDQADIFSVASDGGECQPSCNSRLEIQLSKTNIVDVSNDEKQLCIKHANKLSSSQTSSQTVLSNRWSEDNNVF
jgi:hypothetical protein